MKNKIITLLVLLLLALGVSGVMEPAAVRAQEQEEVSGIGLSSYPSKTTYTAGEALDLTGMEIICLYKDKTSSMITDYTVEGFDTNLLGNQTITIKYMDSSVSFRVEVIPGKVNNLAVSEHTANSYTLTWDAIANCSYYKIYNYDNSAKTSNLITTVTANHYTAYDISGNIKYYKVSAVIDINGTKYDGALSDVLAASIPPDPVGSLTVENTSQSSVTLSWSMVDKATGYRIFRKEADSEDFTYVEDTKETSYTDTAVSAGTAYQYKVCAYIISPDILGDASPVANACTKLAKVKVKFKAGDGKVRLTWGKASGADAYHVYIGDLTEGYTLLATVDGESNCTYTAEGLITGVTYQFYVTAYQIGNDISYEGIPSDIITAEILQVPDTNTEAKYFNDKEAFIQSSAYQNMSFFQDNVNYPDSYIIPGLNTTNVGGFESTAMCPQGITFAENFLLITAYDMKGEENSVIYVLNKKTKLLLTTLVLPTYTHVGGICYDGRYVWLTTGTKVSSILMSDIEAAAAQRDQYAQVNFFSVNKLGIAASYIAYYDGKLWVGTYDELKTTSMYSYDIYDFGTEVQIEKADTIAMPTRVQGIVFTKDGYLILSRSCQLYAGLRGYMRRLDVYKPELADEVKSLGNCINYVETPSMNEGIAIDGTMLYVNFESAAFENASYIVDRVCAFDLKAVFVMDTSAD